MLDAPPMGYKYCDGYIEALGTPFLCYDGPTLEIDNQVLADYYERFEQERRKPVKQFYKHFDKFKNKKRNK